MVSYIDRYSHIREGYEDGVHWKLTFGLGNHSVNGYVKVPATHEKMTSESYMDLNDYEVHGGLTYSDEEGWLGFDTSHYGDYWPPLALKEIGGTPREDQTYIVAEVNFIWNINLVEKEVINLAQQVSGFKDLT